MTLPEDRLVMSWNKVSQENSGQMGLILAALSGKDTGLYVKGKGSSVGGMDTYELDFGQCTTVWDADSAKKLTEERRLHWIKILDNLEGDASTPLFMINDQVKESMFIRLLNDTLRKPV